ncbi:unnamed protein product [Penicillium salamii]|nr:unnamed protein product [Penicillium salamii]CAG8342771.1 unnamed protein product [Penicillium salamii]
MNYKKPERKTRSRHSNSRSGCKTCKARHKKCDEARPACLQCTSSGRQCEGYELFIDKRTRTWRDFEANDQNALALRSQHASNPGPFLAVTHLPFNPFRPNLTWNERWYLDFYRHRAAPLLSSDHASAFWNVLALQICDQHPVVCHAAIAMGAWYYQLERDPSGHKKGHERLLALYHSTKAISSLREILAQESSNPKGLTMGSPSHLYKELILATCVIFAMLAFLQGDLSTFRSHLVSGFKLFRQWGVAKNSLYGLFLKEISARIHCYCVFYGNTEILKVFPQEAAGFHVHIAMLPSHTALLPEAPISVLTPIKQLDQDEPVMALFGGLLLKGTFSDFEIGPANFIRCGAAVIFTRVQFSIASGQFWRDELIAILEQSESLAPQNCNHLNLIAIWADIIGIKVAVAETPDTDEMAFDDHLAQFQRVTKMAQEVAESSLNADQFAPMFYRNAIFPALLWAGVKCRDWLVRREICYILRNLAGDHYWVRAISAAFSRFVLVESDGVKWGETIPKAARFDSVRIKICREESRVELRYRTAHTLQLENAYDHWESDLIYY